jgi:hypothetical protein
MSRNLIDAFFTITENDRRVGFVTQGGKVARFDWDAGKALDVDAVPLSRRWPQLPERFTVGFDAALSTQADNPWTWVFRGEHCLRHPCSSSPVDAPGGPISACSTLVTYGRSRRPRPLGDAEDVQPPPPMWTNRVPCAT